MVELPRGAADEHGRLVVVHDGQGGMIALRPADGAVLWRGGRELRPVAVLDRFVVALRIGTPQSGLVQQRHLGRRPDRREPAGHRRRQAVAQQGRRRRARRDQHLGAQRAARRPPRHRLAPRLRRRREPYDLRRQRRRRVQGQPGPDRQRAGTAVRPRLDGAGQQLRCHPVRRLRTRQPLGHRRRRHHLAQPRHRPTRRPDPALAVHPVHETFLTAAPRSACSPARTPAPPGRPPTRAPPTARSTTCSG